MEDDNEPEEVCLASLSIDDGEVIGIVCTSFDVLNQGVMIPHGVYGTALTIPRQIH